MAMANWDIGHRSHYFTRPHFLRLGRWVRADPAAVFAALLEFGFLRTFDAADAAFLLVTSLFALRAILITSFQIWQMLGFYRSRLLTSSISLGEPKTSNDRLSRERPLTFTLG